MLYFEGVVQAWSTTEEYMIVVNYTLSTTVDLGIATFNCDEMVSGLRHETISTIFLN